MALTPNNALTCPSCGWVGHWLDPEAPRLDKNGCAYDDELICPGCSARALRAATLEEIDGRQP